LSVNRKLILASLILVIAVSLTANAYLLAQNFINKPSLPSIPSTITDNQTIHVIEPVVTTTTLSTATTTKTMIFSTPETSDTINSKEDIDFWLSLGSPDIVDYLPFPTALNVTLSMYDSLSTPNNVPASNNWTMPSLNSGCPSWYPFGFGIFEGFYDTSNISSATNQVNIFGNFSCPGFHIPNSYDFVTSNLTSPFAESFPISGSGSRAISNPNCNCDTDSNIPLAIGTYTAVADDEWGDLLLLHFAVVQDPGSLGLSKWDTSHIITVQNASEFLPPGTNVTDYTFEVTVGNGNNSTEWTIDPDDFTLVTTNHQIAYTQLVQSEHNVLRSVIVGPGKESSGEVAFEIPSGESPLLLEYNDSANLLYTGTDQFPKTVSWLSVIEGFSVEFSTSGLNTSTLSGQASSPDLVDPGEPGYYTGDLVNVTLTLSNFYQSPSNITVASINASNDFVIENITPSLPVKLNGYQTFNVTLIVPDVSFWGYVNFTVVAS